LLISLFLFNAGGYQVLHAYLQHELDISLENQLDNHYYDEASLISVKVASFCLPYSSFSSQFERVHGEIEMNGKLYKFVKRRIFNDSLEFLCIPDVSSMRLRVAKNDFFKLVNDLQASTQGKKSDGGSHIYKIFSPDYCSLNDAFSLQGPLPLSPYGDTHHAVKVNPVYLSPAGQPPDAA
jgi:hypothetical protein